MVKVQFQVDGHVEVATGEPGESIMQVAVRTGVARVIGECGGEMSCATCHLWVPQQHGFRPRSGDEDELLELVDDRTEDSRLSCQLVLAEGMDEITVTVP